MEEAFILDTKLCCSKFKPVWKFDSVESSDKTPNYSKSGPAPQPTK